MPVLICSVPGSAGMAPGVAQVDGCLDDPTNMIHVGWAHAVDDLPCDVGSAVIGTADVYGPAVAGSATAVRRPKEHGKAPLHDGKVVFDGQVDGLTRHFRLALYEVAEIADLHQ
jgi:hypothetical protein